MGVSPYSATPLSCGVLADVNSRLMPSSLRISENRPYINSGASSERIIAGGPTSLVSAKYVLFQGFWGIRLVLHEVFPRHPGRIITHDKSVLLSTYGMHWLFARGVDKNLPCLLSDRDWVVFFTGALNPFAAEHPTHGSSLTPGFKLNSLLLHGFPQQTGVGVDGGAVVVVNIHIRGGQKPGGDYGAG